MKDLGYVKKILSDQKPILVDRFKVKEVGIFGSYARREQRELSDIDILVEFSEPVGWEFVDLLEYLEEMLGLKVDLATPNALRPQFKNKILREVAYV